MTLPKVSVVIPTYNRKQYVRRAIDSVLAQTFKEHEIIVVDDGSTDGTRQLLAAYRDKVRYIYKHNGGAGSARNLGINHAQGQYTAFLDSDDTWLPEKLAIQLSQMESNPRVGLSYTDKQTISEDGTVLSDSQRWNCPSGRAFEKLLMANYISTTSVVVCRTECFDKVGLFDETMPACQDYEMWLRIAYHYDISYVNLPLTRYAVHPHRISCHREQVYRGDLYAMKRILELYGRESPDLRLAVRKRLLQLHRGFGLAFFRSDDLSQARPALKSAIVGNPLDATAWFYFLTTYLNPGAIRALRRIKNTLLPQNGTLTNGKGISR